MNEVIFPLINLKLNINKIAFSIFTIKIYWYAIFIISSVIIGIFLSKKNDGKYDVKFETILEILIITIPISIIFARLYYVVFSLDYYKQNPLQIINIRNGGIAIYGGIIGAIATIYIYCKKNKIDFLNILDFLVPYLALGQAIGRWGNFFNIEAYGRETTSIFRMGIIENGRYIEVHPTFLYESFCTLLIFFLLTKISKNRKYKGQIVSLYLILYSSARFFIEGLRTDSLMFKNFRVSQILSLLIILVVLIILIYKKVKKENIINEKK